MSLSNSGGIFPKGNTNGEEKNYSYPNNRTWCCPAGTILTDTLLVVSPLPLPPLLLLPLWWWAHCPHCCCCGVGNPLPPLLPAWWWARRPRWHLHGDNGDGPWGNITRWSIGIGMSVCAISNMTHCGHVISLVLEQVTSCRRGTGVGAEWQTLRRAAGA